MRKYHWKLPVTVTVFGLLLTFFLVHELDQNQRKTLHLRFSSQVTRDLATLQKTMDLYEYGLKGLRGPFIVKGPDEVLPSDIQKYLKSREIDQEFPGAKGFGFIRRVPPARLGEFLDLVHRQGQSEFQIQEINSNLGEHFIIRYVYPEGENRQALGLDIASEANRRQAAVTAMKTGVTTLTAPITLVQNNNAIKKGMLFLLPVYQSGVTPATQPLREQACVGWVYAPLLITDILAKSGIRQDLVQYSISDVEDQLAEPFYQSTGDSPAMNGVEFRQIRTLHLFGRIWQITAVPTQSFVADLQPVALQSYLLLGAFLSILAGVLSYLAHSNYLRKQGALSTQKSLIENQKLLDLLISHAPVSLAMFDLKMHYLVASPKWRSFYALPEGNLFNVICPGVFFEGQNNLSPMYQRVLKSGVSESGEQLVTDAVGQSRWIRWEVLPWRDSSDRVGGLVIFSEDITQAKQAQAALLDLNSELERRVQERTSELDSARRTLRTVFDAVPSMIGYWDRNEINRIANKAYADWFKVDPDQLPGMSMKELLGPVIYKANKPHIDAALAGYKQEFERSIPVPDGSGRVRHSFATYLPDRVNDEVVGFYVLVFDVTEVTESRIRLDRALQENQLLLATIKNQICFSMTDLQGNILEVNPLFLQVCGYSESELIGRTHHRLSSGVHDKAFWRDLWETVLAGKTWRGEVCNRDRHGELFWLDMNIAPLFDHSGQVDRFLSMSVDITAQKKTVIELERAKLASDLANRAKSEFLANMSHEIRTPLNAVIGLSHLMSQYNSEADLGNYVQKIQTASKALLSIVNDVLDLSKIEAGELSLEEHPFSLRLVLGDVEQLFAGQFQSKGVDLNFPHATDPHIDLVRGDQTRLRQVLINFVSNALKFTESGSVTLKLMQVEDAGLRDDQIKLQFDIEDTGLGMSSETLSRLFHPFSQADSSITRRFGGSGLGLSIVKRLVELMGGQVGVSSELGQGSRFWFTAVLGRAGADDGSTEAIRKAHSSTESDEPGMISLQGVRVLLVDDSELNLEVASALLRRQGALVEVCTNGADAIAALQERGQSFDVVLIDIQMPVMDGISAVKVIRQNPALHDLPIIALTAGAMLSEKQRALEAGMDDYLTKPFDPEIMTRLIRRVVKREIPLRIPEPLQRPVENAPWPALPGFDMEGVRSRLNDDWPLFLSMCDQLLCEFSDWPDLSTEPDCFETLTASAHKLAGSAGLLGMMAVYRAAKSLEEAFNQGQNGTIRPLFEEVGQCLVLARQQLAPAMETLAVSPERRAHSTGDLPDLHEFAKLLENHDLSASDRFPDVRRQLQGKLDQQQINELASHIASLNFEAALALLKTINA